MYKSFFGLTALPFKIDTDPTFLWLGEKHREAISMLKYGIQGEGHTGVLLLTGDVGTGKTTLINALFNSLDKRVIRVAITNPSLSGLDFLNYVAAAFGSKRQFPSKSQFLIHFTKFLQNARARQRKVLLVVDEAQLLSQELLEEIRLFSNIEHKGQSLIHTFLVGQSEVRAHLSHPQCRALNQRISLNYHIEALVLEETLEYVRYRLQVAGARDNMFTPEAVQLVHRFASGLPRMINIICDHALLTGYVQHTRSITAPIILECVRELAIPVTPAMTEPARGQEYFPPDDSPPREAAMQADDGFQDDDPPSSTETDPLNQPAQGKHPRARLFTVVIICLSLLICILAGVIIFL